jgi:RNA polymerase sigma-70 factor (ECF subfamily)
MTDTDLEELRRQGFGVAYRMLGSVATPRTSRRRRCCASAVRPTTRTSRPWVTTVTTRLAIDHLRRARVHRETYIDPPTTRKNHQSGGHSARAPVIGA